MRCLADENFPAATVAALRERGHDIAWIRVDSPGSTDLAVLERAQSEERILLTFDKDFGELAFKFGLLAASGVILFRVPTPSPEFVTHTIVSVLESRTDWASQFALPRTSIAVTK